MTRWVVDASVAAKWVAPEPESPAADTLLGQTLLAPDLIYAELANILWKKQQRSEMSAAAADLAARWLQQVPLQVHASAGLMPQALQLAQRLQHPAYDCFYLALAQQADGVMVTADQRFYRRCQQPDAADLASRVRLLQVISVTGEAGWH